MTATALPFRRRAADSGAAGGSGSVTFCRFCFRVEGALAGSDSGAGLGSCAGAFRFFDGGGGGLIEEAGVGAAAAAEGETDEPDEVAACRAEERVLLGDMSIWLCTVQALHVSSRPSVREGSHEVRDVRRVEE